jgi:hypothetical protein
MAHVLFRARKFLNFIIGDSLLIPSKEGALIGIRYRQRLCGSHNVRATGFHNPESADVLPRIPVNP